MGLRYGGKIVNDYSAMRGPCNSGFHIPMIGEWQGINTIMTGLNIGNGEDWGNYLKLPFAGYVDYGGVDWVTDIGYCGYYWTCSPDQSNLVHEIYFDDNDGAVDISYIDEKGYASSIRPFKDTFVVPTASWTVLAGTLGGAGVFYDATLGLISITSNGTTGYTMADKNIGATVVYNYGDALSDANCGKYFQRGNNYGFTGNSITTTSSTQVDASGYGPGNYYSSSTFITDYGDWSSVPNDNLRGGVTGVQQRPAPIVKRYYGGKIVNDYSAMRGPCPEGFHVPSDSERVTLCGILTTTFSLSSNATTMGTYLKMPMAGFRNYSSASVSSLGTYGSYRSLSSRSQDYTYYLRFSSSNISPQLGRYRSSGFSIRCFKNNPVIPNTSWVTLYQGGGSAGIYWDSTNGLISVSGDGLTWYTIHDKNLGATTVYNQGDTLTDANCGYFYQWGNNYGFAHSGTLTTSSTQVDASNYGPGNYYSSSTFIKRASSPYDWSSVQNDNLRGGETGVQQRPAEVIKVYKGNTLIREKP